MKVNTTRARLLLLAMWLIAPPLLFSEDPPPQQRIYQPRTVFSATRRFVVSGLPMAPALEVARWAESVADRISAELGPIPFERGLTLQIEASADTRLESFVHGGQGCIEGEVWQKLMLRGLNTLDYEQAEEALGSLLISRYAQAMQEPMARCLEPARAPDWLVVGLVHRSRLDLRRRDQAAAFQRWSLGSLESCASLFGSYFMPSGRWPQKADATLLVMWLLETPRGSAVVMDALREQAAGRAPDAAWWAEHLLGERNVARAERLWDLWIADQRDRARTSSAGDLHVLLGMSTIPASDLEAAAGPAELAGAPLSALIAERNAPWVRSFSVRLALRFRLEALGQEEAAVSLAERYAIYLDAVAKGKSARKLKALWKAAEDRRAAFESAVAARRRYLDAVEERIHPGAPDGGGGAVQRYLDAVEQRLETP